MMVFLLILQLFVAKDKPPVQHVVKEPSLESCFEHAKAYLEEATEHVEKGEAAGVKASCAITMEGEKS